MSGDAHVRKRGADKRRKKVEEAVEETVPLLIPAPAVDENIHVHKDAHLGGNFLSKIVFFCLFGTLALLVGLLIIEFQGSGDVESAIDSPWSVMLEGWVDELHDDHEHEEHSIPDHSEEEEGEHEGSFSLYGTSDSDSDHDHEETDEEGSHEDHHDDETDNDVKSEEFGFVKSIYQRIYSNSEASGEKAENEADENDNDENDANENDDNDENDNDDNDDNDNDNDNDDDDNDNDNGNDEADDNDDEADENNDENDVEESQEEEADLFGEKNDDDYYANDLEGNDNEEENKGMEEEEEEEEREPEPVAVKKGNGRKSRDVDEEKEEADDELIRQILSRSQERKTRFENSRERPHETEAEEHIRNVMNGLRKKKLEEEVSQEVFDEERLKEVDEQDEKEETPQDEEEVVQEVIDDDDNQETVGVILKFGVGVALIVVAHVVLIRKWNSWESGTTGGNEEESTDKGDIEGENEEEAQVIDRRESLVDVDAQLPTPSGSEDEGEEEEGTPEDSEDGEIAEDNYVSKTAYEASATPVESEAESNAEGTDEEADDGAHPWKTEEDGEGEPQTEPEEETEEEEEEEEEEESPPPSPPKPQPQPNPRKRGGPRSDDVDFEQEYYEYSDITNEYDWAIRNELDFAEDEFFNGSVEKAKSRFSALLSKHPNSVRALYGVAKCIDGIADKLKSNTHLLQSVDIYSQILDMPNVPDALYLQIANRTIERMRFKGLYQKLVPIHNNLIRRFHKDPIHRNDLAVTFLLLNRLDDAKTVLENVLKRWPTDGMAAAHYGFILKTEKNLTAGAKYLRIGIESNHSGAQDSRFYFHLGDALHRLGQKEDALKIYKLGEEKGLFHSVYQRSLYNVDRLTPRPWWTLEQTTYADFFRKLEENWKIIRREALSVLNKNSEFVDEAENLRSAGDWKQFELFARGRRMRSNCEKVPITCGIVSAFESASTCTRGQVKLSVMMPGTHVWAHCGPTNCRLRAHLGLIVPPNTFLRVAEETRSWEEGKVLIFDDSFEHEVWHNGTSPRLILIVDTWHPDLTQEERKSLTPI